MSVALLRGLDDEEGITSSNEDEGRSVTFKIRVTLELKLEVKF